MLTRALFSACVVLATGVLAASDLTTVYAPLVYTYPPDQVPEDGTVLVQSGWESKLSAFNPTGDATTMEVLAAHGPDGPVQKGMPSANLTELPPYAGGAVNWGFATTPRFGIAFLEMRAAPEVSVSGDLVWSKRYLGCGNGLGSTKVPQGQVALPVFRSLFPAGRTAIAGAVELGRLMDSPYCPEAARKYQRRVNVTLFNAGDAEATFVVTELPLNGITTPLYETTRMVGAKRVLQINSIPVPMEDSPEIAGPINGDAIWFKVTANQPFLFYVSTVFEDPEPGAAAFQVYTPSLLPLSAQ